MKTTWDGLPISPDPPHGCSVVVVRREGEGMRLLMLHRAHRGPDYEGDWAWTSPSGARLPGEDVLACARRELAEETGLRLPLRRTTCSATEWETYWAHAPHDATVTLDGEHDRYAWLPPETALSLAAPEMVRQALACVVALVRVSDDQDTSR